MRRFELDPRPDWQSRLTELGMDLSQPAVSPYWAEDAAYEFREAQVEAIYEAARDLEAMVREAVDFVFRKDRCRDLGIDDALAASAALSWGQREPSLYGRFDLCFDGAQPPKLFEYNADTPTALFEASVVQWHWLQERFPGADQFNSIHEELIRSWQTWRVASGQPNVHFACIFDDDDDLLTTAYLQDVATQAALSATLLEIDDVGWNGRRFVDLEGREIKALFKLYPWEWLVQEAFFPHIATAGLRLVEPAWRIVASSKGLLAILWEMFPGHPNLLPAFLDPSRLDGAKVLKPMLGREGANVIIEQGGSRQLRDGPFGQMPRVVQAFHPLPDFDGWRPVIGAWIAGGEPCGLGIREQRNLITGTGARFVPHLMR